MAPPSSPSVLVTGLSGFTGHYLSLALGARGYKVLAASKSDEPFDLTSAEAVEEVISASTADYLIHLAAISFVGHGNPADFYRVNTIGTITLLEAAARRPRPFRKIILASSANIYGNSLASPLVETTPPAPSNHYAASKLAMEVLAQSWFGRLPLMITRPFNYTGHGQDERFLVPKIVAHFTRRAETIELGNLDVSRDFSDVREIVDAYIDLLEADASGEVVNICSGTAYSLQWIVDTCIELTGHSPRIVVNPTFVRSDEVASLVGANSRLRALTGRAPDRRLDSTLNWMLGAAKMTPREQS